MVLRQAELKDKNEVLETVKGLSLNIPDFVWSEDDFVTRQIQNKEYFVIENEGKLVGAMSLRHRTNKISIETLVIKKPFQSQGFGTKFIEFAKQFTKEKKLNILHAYSFSDYHTTDFYTKRGFKVLDCAGYYNNHKYDCFELRIS